MRCSLPLLVLLLPLSLGANRVVEGLPFADPSVGGESSLRARLLFTSNHLGEFEPCSCADLPLGGLAQGAGRIEAARQETQAPVLVFDAGDRLFQFDLAAISQEEAARRARAVALVDAGNVVGLDAAGIGGLDLGAGLAYLQKLAVRAAYPLLSANLRDPQGQLLFPASTIIARGDLAVGVTSVLPGGLLTDDYQTSDPVAAARSAVRALRGQGVDLVVLLSNVGLKTDRALARSSGADVILGSRSREVLAEGARVGRTVIAHAGSRGRYLGDVRWYGTGRGRGPHVVATTLPVFADGPVTSGVALVVAGLLQRLSDPTLGVEPILPGNPAHPSQHPVEEAR